jgi:hypothetical protein
MATTAPPPVAPAPAPAPTPTPSEWANPATYLHLLAVLLTALFASGTIPATSEAMRIATVIALVLGALGYPVVTSVAASTRMRARAAVTTAVSFVLFLMIGAAAVSASSCAGAHKFGTCTVSSLEADVGVGSGSAGLTVEQAAANALASADYVAEVAKLITEVGEQEAACAILAIDDWASAVSAPAGSGNAQPELVLGRAALLKARADVVIATHRWR